ncbi:MAG: hypothetical protein ABIJ36_01940 [Patescibacteria group bacterium]|nr:hypothetical protein [Patescibacteria group bacterium]
MKLYFILLTIALILALLQTSAFPVFGVYLDIVLVFVLTVVYITPSNFGVKFAFMSGLLMDFIGETRFGGFTFMFTLFSLITQFSLGMFGKKIVNMFLIVSLLTLASQIILGGFVGFGDIFLCATISSVIAMMFYPGINILCEKFGGFGRKLK